MSSQQLVAEWKKKDPYMLDVDGYIKFLGKRLPQLEKERKKHQALGWHKRLQLLDDRNNSIRLEDRVFNDILVKAEDFHVDRKDEFQESIAFLGEILAIHRKFVSEKGMFRDMFSEYMQLENQTNFRAGLFFTPYNVADFMANITLGEVKALGKPQTICDPCAGTGRFMLSVAKHYIDTIGCFNFLMTNIDVDKRVFTYCTMNAILYSIPSINIFGNSLSFDYYDGFAVIPMYPTTIWKRMSVEQIYDYMEPLDT